MIISFHSLICVQLTKATLILKLRSKLNVNFNKGYTSKMSDKTS